MATVRWIPLGVVLATVSVAAVAWGAPISAPEPKPSAWPARISGPVTSRNLAVFFVHGDDVISSRGVLTLEEALANKSAVVHETGTVGELAVENLSATHELFIQAGDIVKGGRQDRVLSFDLLVSPSAGKVPIKSFCVEQGRWQARSAEDTAKFSQSGSLLPGRALRLAVRSARDQGQVWEKVREQQDRLAKRLKADVTDPSSRTSLQLTLENSELKAKVGAYVAKLEKGLEGRSGVLGAVFAINGRIESAEVYGSAALFRKMWPKLLRAAAITAYTEYQENRRYEAAEVDEVAAFLAAGDRIQPKETSVHRRVLVLTWDTPGCLATETRDRDQRNAVWHRSYLAR